MSELHKAWFYNEYGSIDVLQFGEIHVPKRGHASFWLKSELLLSILSTLRGTTVYSEARVPTFLYDMSSLPLYSFNISFISRGNHAVAQFGIVPGCDAAGVVVEFGDGISKFKKGDEVYSNIQNARGAGRPKQRGTLAQYTLVDEYLVALKPKNLSFEEAASLPLDVLTAHQAFDIAKFEKGKSAFIVGEASVVGSLAIQLARHVYGTSRIVSTSRTVKLEFMKSLGPDVVIDYTKQSYNQISEKFNFVFDTIGKSLTPLKFDFVFDTIGDSSKSHVVAKEDAKVLNIVSFRPHGRVE